MEELDIIKQPGPRLDPSPIPVLIPYILKRSSSYTKWTKNTVQYRSNTIKILYL